MKPGHNMESRPTEEFDIASGAPFNALQKRLGLIRDGRLNIGRRVALFVFIAWCMPLILCGIGGPGSGPEAVKAYLLEMPVWARYFIAVALFVMMEKQARTRLQALLRQFFHAPILSRTAFAPATDAVRQAVRECDSRRAEFACLLAAIAVSWTLHARLTTVGDFSWARQPGAAGAYVTLAGWWVIGISNLLFSFLLFRWFWRFLVWCRLLGRMARLEMRLVSTHPDGRAGLSFVSKHANAFTLFVLAIGCVVGAVLATQLMNDSLEASLYGYVMALWLALVLVAFCAPLLPFNKPLAKLKEDTLIEYNALATRHFRAAERSMLGENVAAADEDGTAEQETPDPSKTMLLVEKQSVSLINIRSLLPIQLAALLPLAITGITFLPLKEILALMKKILLF